MTDMWLTTFSWPTPLFTVLSCVVGSTVRAKNADTDHPDQDASMEECAAALSNQDPLHSRASILGSTIFQSPRWP